jgi:protein-tyrosine phosphatase
VSIDAWPGERARNGGADEIPLAGVAGRLWLCGKHFVGPDPEHALRTTGASTVVCLTETTELLERYPHYVAWLHANQPSRAVWFPIPDLHAPDLDTARPLLDDLVERLRSGEGLLVHCGAGIGRAGTVAVAILMATGTPLAAAMTVVAAHRAMAGPEAGAQRALLDALAGQH